VGEVHHIKAWIDGGITELENLVGLCRKCHTLVTIGSLILTGSWSEGYTWRTATRACPLARAG
jgi:hypothetical protein